MLISQALQLLYACKLLFSQQQRPYGWNCLSDGPYAYWEAHLKLCLKKKRNLQRISSLRSRERRRDSVTSSSRESFRTELLLFTIHAFQALKVGRDSETAATVTAHKSNYSWARAPTGGERITLRMHGTHSKMTYPLLLRRTFIVGEPTGMLSPAPSICRSL